MISKKWRIPQEIYDLHLGKRNDIKNEIVKVDQVFFHIPFLTQDNVYVLWTCLWPDCHNCCNRQTGLPLTMDDIKTVSKKLVNLVCGSVGRIKSSAQIIVTSREHNGIYLFSVQSNG